MYLQKKINCLDEEEQKNLIELDEKYFVNKPTLFLDKKNALTRLLDDNIGKLKTDEIQNYLINLDPDLISNKKITLNRLLSGGIGKLKTDQLQKYLV